MARRGASGLYGGRAHPGRRLGWDVRLVLTLKGLALVSSGRLALAPGRLLRGFWVPVGRGRRDGAVLGGRTGPPAEVGQRSQGLALTATCHHSALV